jgi:hypothetical protein
VRARARPAPPALPGKSWWRGALRGGAHACAHRCALAGPRRGLSGSKARGRLTAGSVGFAGQAWVVQRTSSKAPAGMFAGVQASPTSMPALSKGNLEDRSSIRISRIYNNTILPITSMVHCESVIQGFKAKLNRRLKEAVQIFNLM